MELAWWFNVGVQIFLCISGYLYGKKTIPDDIYFYKKQFTKILIPYYCTVIPVVLIELVFLPNKPDLVQVIKIFICDATPASGHHLWYISTILTCYVLTPFWSRWFRQNERVVFSLTIMIGICAIVFGAFYRYFNPAWITCYLIGFALGYSVDKFKRAYHLICILVIIFSTTNIAQAILDYIIRIELQGVNEVIYSYWCNYNHIWLGIAIFIVLKTVFEKLEIPEILRNFLIVSDKYSYEGYLVHQFLILGPMSLMNLSNNLIINIIVIITLISIFAYILKWVDTPLLEYVRKRI